MAIGITIAVVVFAVVVGLFMRGGGGAPGGSFPPGTRAWESQMTLGILTKMIASREQELRGSPDDAKRALLERQIANMQKQLTLHQAVIASGDVSPGKMRIGVNPDADHID